MKKQKGFTLVELAITLITVIVLMSISVPIYKNNTKNFKMAEGYALLATIRSAQEKYYAEYGEFLISALGSGGNPANTSDGLWTSNEEVLGINAITNKYFTLFCINGSVEGYYPALNFKNFGFLAGAMGENVTIILRYDTRYGVTYKTK